MTLKSILANHLALGLIASGLSAQIGTIDDGESGASIRAKLNTAITEVNDLGAAGFLTGDDLELNNHTPAGDWTFAEPLTSAGLISNGMIGINVSNPDGQLHVKSPNDGTPTQIVFDRFLNDVNGDKNELWFNLSDGGVGKWYMGMNDSLSYQNSFQIGDGMSAGDAFLRFDRNDRIYLLRDTYFTGMINGDGSSIYDLNATNITTGTLSTARIPNSIARLADIDTFAKLDAIVSDESLAYFGALPDLDAYQLLVADIPALDWSAGVAYGPSGVLDPRLDWDSRILSGSWTIDYLSVTGLTIGSNVSLPPASVTRTEIADDAIGANQLDTLGAYTAASLSLTSVLQLSDIDIDPTDPAPGASVLWLSSGADSGDAGDLMVKINSGGTVTTFTLIDFAP